MSWFNGQKSAARPVSVTYASDSRPPPSGPQCPEELAKGTNHRLEGNPFDKPQRTP